MANITQAYKFCPQCGQRFIKHQENWLACKNRHRYFNNPRPTNAAIILNQKGEIMFVKRKIAPKKGFWDLPGGFVDVGETMEQSVAREVEEETGIKAIKISNFASYPLSYMF